MFVLQCCTYNQNVKKSEFFNFGNIIRKKQEQIT